MNVFAVMILSYYVFNIKQCRGPGGSMS